MNRERLTKLMMLTTSDNDGEALNALRMANRMLAAARLNWAEVLDGRKVGGIKVGRPSYAESRSEYSAQTGGKYDGDPYRPTGSKRSRRRRSDDPLDHHTDMFIATMLDDLAQRRHSMEFLIWLSGVTKFWQDRGYLTEKQYGALHRAYYHGRTG